MSLDDGIPEVIPTGELLRPGRAGHSDEHYAQVAAAYKVGGVNEVARQLGVPYRTAANFVITTRKKGHIAPAISTRNPYYVNKVAKVAARLGITEAEFRAALDAEGCLGVR